MLFLSCASQNHTGLFLLGSKQYRHPIYLYQLYRLEKFKRVELTREQNQQKAMELETWLNQIIATNQVLPLDATRFKIWAKLMHRQSDTVNEDAMIAATAIHSKLIIVTRNIKDFKRFNVKLLNPFEAH